LKDGVVEARKKAQKKVRLCATGFDFYNTVHLMTI
jgi:hypothetical protein